MKHQDEFARIEQRVRHYWYNDGLGELASGGLIFLIGIYLGGYMWFPKGSLGRAVLDGSLIIFLAGGMLATRWLVAVLKRHVTYPRTGYVAYPSGWKNPWRIPLVIGTLGVILAVLLVPFRESVSSFYWLPPLIGLLNGLFFLVWGRASGLKRFFILAIFSVALGAALPFSGLDPGYSIALFCGLMGAVSLFSGGLTLHRYLRDNPLPVETEHER